MNSYCNTYLVGLLLESANFLQTCFSCPSMSIEDAKMSTKPSLYLNVYNYITNRSVVISMLRIGYVENVFFMRYTKQPYFPSFLAAEIWASKQ